MRCLFEDRLARQSLALTKPVKRIAVCDEKDLEPAFTQIAQAQKEGHWVALALDYSLGHWLEPALNPNAGARPGCERLVAWVFEKHEWGQTPAFVEQLSDAQSQATEGSTRSTTRRPTSPAAIKRVTPTISKPQYLAMIEDIKTHIQAGDVYQVNATFALDVVSEGDPYALYQTLAANHPSQYSAYIDDGVSQILSFSPELFLRREGDQLTTRPMKGTGPRMLDDPVKDKAIGQALLASDKDRAENLMIVDLLRNDLGRIAQLGSVKVAPLFELEAYQSVWTMTSTIKATLAPNTSLATILKALFPCGSVTGAPKIAAMRMIDRLEMSPRGVYCGSIGWLAPSGDFCFNVAIRTLVLDQFGKGQYHVGSGIVNDSVAQQEWEECFWKARVLGTDLN
jgi:para-aminobenzoate synthetase component 1